MKRALAHVGSQHVGAACGLSRGEGSCVQSGTVQFLVPNVGAVLGEVIF